MGTPALWGPEAVPDGCVRARAMACHVWLQGKAQQGINANCWQASIKVSGQDPGKEPHRQGWQDMKRAMIRGVSLWLLRDWLVAALPLNLLDALPDVLLNSGSRAEPTRGRGLE